MGSTCACLLICMVSCFEIQFCFAKKALQIIVQIGVGGLSKHRKKLKVRGEAKYFNALQCALKPEETQLTSI